MDEIEKKVRDSIGMEEYNEEFTDKKTARVRRDKVTCGIDSVALAPWINLFELEMEEDGKDHRNCFNDLINLGKILDDSSDIFLEVEGLRKEGSSDSLDGRELVMVDACDFVDGYAIMMKNGGLEVTIRVLATLKDWRSKRGPLFEGRLWRMDVDDLMVTVQSDMEYWVEGANC